MLLHLRSKRAKVILSWVVPPLISVLTAIVSPRGMTHIAGVMKKEKWRKLVGRLAKFCW